MTDVVLEDHTGSYSIDLQHARANKGRSRVNLKTLILPHYCGSGVLECFLFQAQPTPFWGIDYMDKTVTILAIVTAFTGLHRLRILHGDTELHTVRRYQPASHSDGFRVGRASRRLTCRPAFLSCCRASHTWLLTNAAFGSCLSSWLMSPSPCWFTRMRSSLRRPAGARSGRFYYMNSRASDKKTDCF